MRVYICQQSEGGSALRFSSGNCSGYHEYHESTGLPYGDSFYALDQIWDVPEAYETEYGDIMVPDDQTHLRWADIWPHKPAGSKRLWKRDRYDDEPPQDLMPATS